jgi:hypothetical protein
MNFVTLNKENYLVESTIDDTLNGALRVKNNTVNLSMAKNYLKSKNLGTLQDISFGNAVFTTRELTTIESGFINMAITAMEEAEQSAMAVLVNTRFDELMGEL